MASSVDEDQDQRSNAGLEDFTTMTIESLRARLLSERAISKSSRQRADELSKRVLELEEQLKMVSRQRKKAEKATADVLAILESNGISDASDAYDSNSDQEAVISDCMVSNDTMKRKETSSNFEVRRSEMEAYSSSEIDSSASTGRSLSWKSSKGSVHSLERTKYMETGRRRSATFTSNGSLPKRVGKSCRRIRRRESRSVAEKLQNDGDMHDLQGNTMDTYSEDSPNCADIKHLANGRKHLPEGAVSGLSENRVASAYFSGRNVQDEGMEGTLQHQAESIGQYEAEEKSQREWEEKVRENSCSVLDSCDPGNRSDVTEERNEGKASSQLNNEGATNAQNQRTKLEDFKTKFAEELELKIAKNMVIPPPFDTGYLQDKKPGSRVGLGAPSSEFTFTTAEGKHSQVFSGNMDKTPSGSSHTYVVPNGSQGNISAHGPSLSTKDGESSVSRNELALIPQKFSNNIESVLEALQQARLSLNQKFGGVPLSEIGSSGKGIEVSVPDIQTGSRVEIPAGCPGLFRLPTDFQSKAIANVNYLGSNSALTSGNCYPEPASERFLGSPYVEPRSSTLLGDQFCTSSAIPLSGIRSGVHRPTQTPPFPQDVSGVHYSAMPFTKIQQGIPALRPVFENGFDAGVSSSGISRYLDPQMNSEIVLPSRYSYPTYPFYPEVALQVPTNERLSRNVPSMEYGIPSSSHLSLYDDHLKPNMYK